MYVILVNEDNSLTTTKRERIMHRSKLVDKLWILVHPIYKNKECDMTLFSVTLEYILPCSKQYHTIELVQDPENYEEYLKYVLNFDTNLTSEPGDIEFQLSFTYVGLDADGNSIQRVRKTSTNTITIVPISAWSDIVPDSALSIIDQKLIQVDARIKQLADMGDVVLQNQVDNLKYDATDETLQLTSNGNGVGDKVSVRDMIDEGTPVINIDGTSNKPDIPDEDDSDNNNGCNCNGSCECGSSSEHNNIVEFD